jgi:serine/threonine protein kinase/tetratricopeptide (TPR) repeat protein
MSPCPTPETLSRLACDSSSGARFATMESHVQMCANCQEVLERLAADASVSEERASGRLAEPEHPPTIPGFVIEGVLGRGGMAVVYQAWQPQLARRVAIKIVSASDLIGAEDRRRWLREAQAIGRVRHPNVVRLHEAGERDGCLYLVLDLIAGGSLADRVAGPLPARVAVELMATVTRAVDQIHRAGMLHLDIKPSNILLDGPPDGPWDQVVPMLADFGIARAGDDPGARATGPIGVRGTPSFMAPEQIAGDRDGIGPRSDVHALGATLYSLLTGRAPFQAASVIETLDLVRTREPAPPRTLVPGLPRDLETIALTCLRKDPRRRYASAGALADELQRWLDGFPIRARPVSKLEHVSRWCRRRPAFASLLAVLAVTVASSLVGLLTLWRHSEAERERAENALARAIESDKATSGAVRELVGLLATTVDAPQMLASERFEKTSHVVRDLTAKLRRHPVFAASNLVAICKLERQLGEEFRRRGDYAQSSALLIDSLDLLEGRRYASNDPDVDEAYAQALIELGLVEKTQNRFDEALVCFQRAEDALEGLVHNPRHLDVIVAIDESRHEIASIFGRRDLEEPRRRLLESHIRMLERLSEHAGADPVIGLIAALVRLDLAPDDGARAKLRAAIQRFPANERLPQPFDDRVARWIAKDVNPYPSGPNPTGEPRGRLNPDAHAELVIRALEARCQELGVSHRLLPAAAIQVATIAYSRGKEQRTAGRLDDARQTAACLSAFAQTLARRDPDEAAFHVLLCMALEQEAKNAWEVKDYATIEAAQRKALAEASAALRLDPRNAGARLRVAGLQDRLFGLASVRPSSR